jgi:HSP20 family molecular chaperone IbpA
MASDNWELLFRQRATNILRQVERIQANFLQIAVGSHYRGGLPGRSWAPPVNVVDTGASLWVLCALPGITVKDVDLLLEGGELIIRGQRPLPDCCQDGELRLWEIPLGRFERRISVVEGGVTLALGKVNLQNGLLIIELKKKT